MNGKLVSGAIVLAALAAGAGMYWTQVYAFYKPVEVVPGQEIMVTLPDGIHPLTVRDFTAIDADSSPLRYRACFTAQVPPDAVPYPAADPLRAPGWFDCFDADAIGHALETGGARAYLSRSAIHPDVDRVMAVFPDGRGYAWHQLHQGAE